MLFITKFALESLRLTNFRVILIVVFHRRAHQIEADFQVIVLLIQLTNHEILVKICATFGEPLI